MRGRMMTGVLVFVLALCSVTSAQAADEFILTAPESEAFTLARRQGLTILQRIPERDVFLVRGPEGVPPDVVMARLLADPEIDDEHDKIFIELNAVVRLPEAGLTAPLYTSAADAQRALANQRLVAYYGTRVWASYVRQRATASIRLFDAHRAYGTGTGIVAVIDSGVDTAHPALAGGLLEGFDFTREAPGASETSDLDASHPILNPTQVAILDNTSVVGLTASTQALLDATQAAAIAPGSTPATFGHGTMVASLVRLVAPGAMILPLKAFDAAGEGRLFNIVRALYQARASGARVVNLSLSSTTPSVSLTDAVRFLDEEKVFVVAAAGNEGDTSPRYPAALEPVIAVASVNAADRPSAFTNTGAFVALAAPGEAVVAAFPGSQYALGWGTSFATPLVSGTIALMQQVKSGINLDEVRRALSQAAPLSVPGLGAGRLNVWFAVSDAAGVPVP